MKHVSLFFASIASLLFGFVAVWKTNASTFGLSLGAVFVLLSVGLMAPVELSVFGDHCVSWWKGYRNPNSAPPGAT